MGAGQVDAAQDHRAPVAVAQEPVADVPAIAARVAVRGVAGRQRRRQAEESRNSPHHRKAGSSIARAVQIAGAVTGLQRDGWPDGMSTR